MSMSNQPGSPATPQQRDTSDLFDVVDELRDELEKVRDENRELHDRVDELENKNDELRSEIEDVNSQSITKTSANHVFSSILGQEADDYNADVYQHKTAAEDFNDRFGELEAAVKRHESVIEEEGTATGDTKEQAWKQVVKVAENLSGHQKHALPDDRVLLYAKQIEEATGYGNRRALQLIEEWPEEKEGVSFRPYKRLSTGVQQKALKVDLNVWGGPDE